MRLLFPLLIAPLLSGCLLIAAGMVDAIGVNDPADEATLKKFRALCEAGSGLSVYKSVENVEGVFDRTSKSGCSICEDALVNTKYEYVEFEVSPDAPSGFVHPFLFDRRYTFVSGLYRATLKPAHHPDCGIFYEVHESYYPNKEYAAKHLEYIHRKLGGRCISINEIDKVTTDYAFKEYRRETITKERLFLYRSEWSNYYTGELHAKYAKVVLNKNITRHEAFYPDKISEVVSCPAKNSPEFEEPSVEKVFIPAHQNRASNFILTPR